MTPLAKTDLPSIVTAAGQFICCEPKAKAELLRTYLLQQAAISSQPPCVTPAAPLNVRSSPLPGNVDPNTNIKVSWNPPKNGGSLITKYIVSWGTTQGGPYTNSATVGLTTHNYTISGLTQGTNYYIVVQSFSFAGCVSANSTELSVTTSGAAPGNHLLNGLVSYWNFDANTSPAPDSVGSNNLTLGGAASVGVIAGIINSGASLGVGGSSLRPSSQTDFSFGAGLSFTFSAWIYATSWATPTGTFICFVSRLVTSISNRDYLVVLENDVGTNYVAWGATDTNGTATSINFGLPSNSAWHHLVFGFDSSINKIFGQLDNGTRLTSSTTSNGIRAVVGGIFSFGEYALGDENAIAGLRLDEIALYHRALSTADVANLYNGGAGLPLSSFTS